MALSGPTGGGSSSGVVVGTVIGTVPKFEPQSTNLLLFSQAFDNVAWGGAAVVAADSTVAPDGTLTADTLTDTGVGLQQKTQSGVVVNDSLPYTASCYFLAGSSVDTRIDFSLTGGVAVAGYIEFNPASGAIIAASGTAYSIAAYQIGSVTWIRAQVTLTNNNSGNTAGNIALSPAAASAGAGGNVIAWGAQIEKQLAATGYIPTAGAAVTRAAGKIAPWLLNVAETVLAKVGAYAVDAISDSGKLITASGTFNVSLPAAASAGNGFVFEVRNIGTGIVTLVANGAEKIYLPGDVVAGSSNVALPYSGSTVGAYNVSGLRLVCDGAAWWATSTCETHGVQRFTSSGSWVAPQGVTAAWISGAGGGGAGGGSAFGPSGGGGGSGAIADRVLVAVVPGTSYAVTIAAAGASTSIGALLTLGGGGAGQQAGGAGVTAAGGIAGAGGADGSPGTCDGILTAGAGGNGGGVGAGRGGPVTGAASAGSAADANTGAGGGGSAGGGAAGAGGTGYLTVEW